MQRDREISRDIADPLFVIFPDHAVGECWVLSLRVARLLVLTTFVVPSGPKMSEEP